MRKLAVITSMLVIVSSSNCKLRVKNLVNPAPISLGYRGEVSRTTIIDAMSAQSWAISREEPGQIHATRIVNGKHEMRVLVSYDDVSVRIEYEDSKNLKYSKSRSGKETIHQNYMRWTTNLRWEILQRLSDQRAAKPDLPD